MIIKFTHEHRLQIKEQTLDLWKKTGSKGLLADIIFMDNWTAETEVLRDEICRLILRGVDTELPLRQGKLGKYLNKVETYGKILWYINKKGFGADKACVQVAHELNEPVETIRTRYKAANNDPLFDGLREYGWEHYEGDE